jgi:hypothetical protein
MTRQELTVIALSVIDTIYDVRDNEMGAPEGHLFLAVQTAYPRFGLDDWHTIHQVVCATGLVEHSEFHTLRYVQSEANDAKMAQIRSLVAS